MCWKDKKKSQFLHYHGCIHSSSQETPHCTPDLTLASDLHLCLQTSRPVCEVTWKQLDIYTGDGRPDTLKASLLAAHLYPKTCFSARIFKWDENISEDEKRLRSAPSDRIYISIFKSAIFSLLCWAWANLDVRGNKKQPAVPRTLDVSKPEGDKRELPCRELAPVGLCRRLGIEGLLLSSHGQLCHACCWGIVQATWEEVSDWMSEKLPGKEQDESGSCCQVPATHFWSEKGRLGTSRVQLHLL